MRDRSIDWGRVVAVACFSLLVVGNALALSDRWREGLLAALATAVVLVFYALLTIQYLRRGPARQSDRRPIVWVIALGTLLAPFAVVPVSPGGASDMATILGTCIVIFGISGAIWSLVHLGRNISVIPQVRSLTSTGPYKFTRHPLYVFETFAAMGIVVLNGGGLGWLVLGVLVLCLIVRARWEERLLAENLPEYRDYMIRRRAE